MSARCALTLGIIEYPRHAARSTIDVKELVRAHGGTVDVASSEAHDTTFTIRLPRRPPPA
jgi:sensor histidine kinase regulating citrate/malate metabolism